MLRLTLLILFIPLTLLSCQSSPSETYPTQVKQQVVWNNVQYIIHSVTTDHRRGVPYLRVLMSVHNPTSGTVGVNPSALHIRDATRHYSSPAQFPPGESSMLSSTWLRPGETVTGYVIFYMPRWINEVDLVIGLLTEQPVYVRLYP